MHWCSHGNRDHSRTYKYLIVKQLMVLIFRFYAGMIYLFEKGLFVEHVQYGFQLSNVCIQVVHFVMKACVCNGVPIHSCLIF